MQRLKIQLRNALPNALVWLLLLSSAAHAEEFNAQQWNDLLARADSLKILQAEPEENRDLKGKVVVDKTHLAAITNGLAKVKQFPRLENDEAVTIIVPVVLLAELSSAGKVLAKVTVNAGVLVVEHDGVADATSFAKTSDGVKVLEAMGAKFEARERTADRIE